MKITTSIAVGIASLGLVMSSLAFADHHKVISGGTLTTSGKTVVLKKPYDTAVFKFVGNRKLVAFTCSTRPLKVNATPHVGESFLYIYGSGSFGHHGGPVTKRPVPILSGGNTYHWQSGPKGTGYINVYRRAHTEVQNVAVTCKLIGSKSVDK